MHKLLLPLILTAGVAMFAGCQRQAKYQPPPPVTPERIGDIKEGWVMLYEEPGFKGRVVTLRYPKDMPDFSLQLTDNGDLNFNDEAKSARWQIPEGWQFTIFDDKNYADKQVIFLGTGKVETNPGPLTGHASSGRWERKP